MACFVLLTNARALPVVICACGVIVVAAVSRSSSVSATAWNFEASVAAAQLGLGEYVCKRV